MSGNDQTMKVEQTNAPIQTANDQTIKIEQNTPATQPNENFFRAAIRRVSSVRLTTPATTSKQNTEITPASNLATKTTSPEKKKKSTHITMISGTTSQVSETVLAPSSDPVSENSSNGGVPSVVEHKEAEQFSPSETQKDPIAPVDPTAETLQNTQTENQKDAAPLSGNPEADKNLGQNNIEAVIVNNPTEQQAKQTEAQEEYSAWFVIMCSNELKMIGGAALLLGAIAILLAICAPALVGIAATGLVIAGISAAAAGAVVLASSFGCGFFKQLPPTSTNDSDLDAQNAVNLAV